MWMEKFCILILLVIKPEEIFPSKISEKNCFVVDENNVYDLNSTTTSEDIWVLHKNLSNHLVHKVFQGILSSVLNQFTRLEIYLSVCHPLQALDVRCYSLKLDNVTCLSTIRQRCGKHTSVCALLTSPTGNVYAVNLGKLTNTFQDVNKGTARLSLIYENGSICESNGTRITTRVHFVCKDFTDAFIEISPSSSLCALNLVVGTVDVCPTAPDKPPPCFAFSQATGSYFDFSHLWNEWGLNTTTLDGDPLTFNVCGPLGSEISGSVVVLKGLKVSAGQPSNSFSAFHLQNAQEVFLLKYEHGDQCHSNSSAKYSTTITISCNEFNTEFGLVFFHEDSCDFSISLQTPLACHNQTSCLAHTDIGFHDLRHLKTAVSKFNVTPNVTYDIVLSACHPIEPSFGCPEGAFACLKTQWNQSISLGRAMSPLQFDGQGVPTRFYEDGASCIYLERRKLSLLLQFMCDSLNEKERIYQLASFDNCTPVFGWWSAEACQYTPQEGNCVLKNPHTEEVLNFSSMANEEGYTLHSPDNHTLTINICGPVKDPIFKKGVGSVAMNPRRNAGMFSAKPFWDNMMPTLEYSKGHFCKGGMRLRTVIHFKCITRYVGEHFYELRYLEGSCTFVVFWFTRFACQQKHDCSVLLPNGNTLNLSSLRKPFGEYSVAIDMMPHRQRVQGIVNVCQQVSQSTGCPLGASACLIDGSEVVNMGNFLSPLSTDAQGNPQIVYTNGSICHLLTKKTFSTVITFICNHENVLNNEELVFEKLEECRMLFFLRTMFACPNLNLLAKSFEQLNADQLDAMQLDHPISKIIEQNLSNYTPIVIKTNENISYNEMQIKNISYNEMQIKNISHNEMQIKNIDEAPVDDEETSFWLYVSLGTLISTLFSLCIFAIVFFSINADAIRKRRRRYLMSKKPCPKCSSLFEIIEKNNLKEEK